MHIFDNFRDSGDKGAAAGREFVSKTQEQVTLKAFQLSALTVSTIVKLLVIGSLVSLGFVFLAISSAIALGVYFQNAALGYLSIGIFILFISFLIYCFRKTFDKKVIKKMSGIFFS
jgi:hypothetical protein